jgi:hypothetical protein
LQYTILSIQKNLQWINKIFVVTDNNLTIDGIKTVAPKQIVEGTLSPEMCLHNIPELSEKFVYVNSNTLFLLPCLEK